RPVEGVAVLVALLEVGRPDALLEDELPGLRRLAGAEVLLDDGLSVAELLVVVDEILAAQGRHRGGVCGEAQSPAGDVDVVDAIVADVTTAEVIPPAPDAGQHVGAVGNLGSRPEPEVEVEGGGGPAGFGLANVPPLLTVPGLGYQHLANDPL